MNGNKIPVFVYGSLMSGFHNHGYLRKARFVDPAETADRFIMYDFFNFPGIWPSESGSPVRGELYMVDERTLDRIDILECCPRLYVRQMVALSTGAHAWIYILGCKPDGKTGVILNGDWRNSTLRP